MVRDREFVDTKVIVSTPQVGFEPDEYYGPDRGFRSSTSRLQRCRTALSSRGHRGLVLALAEYGEREGEQEDQNCDHDRECHPLAHPNLLSKASLWRHSIPKPEGCSTDGPALLGNVLYNVATCSSLIR